MMTILSQLSDLLVTFSSNTSGKHDYDQSVFVTSSLAKKYAGAVAAYWPFITMTL